jgi:hypothetical protein
MHMHAYTHIHTHSITAAPAAAEAPAVAEVAAVPEATDEAAVEPEVAEAAPVAVTESFAREVSSTPFFEGGAGSKAQIALIILTTSKRFVFPLHSTLQIKL